MPTMSGAESCSEGGTTIHLPRSALIREAGPESRAPLPRSPSERPPCSRRRWGSAFEGGEPASPRSLARRELHRLVPFDERHREVAAEAFIRFGKGRHPAGLNYGDCMTYATARLAGDALLFIGEDFAQTDLALASQEIARLRRILVRG